MPARRDISQEIISRLDIQAEYKALGVRFASDNATSKGWLSCYAYGREDNSPSAAVNLDNGCYKDHGSGFVSGLWKFAVFTGKFTDWKQARRHYAEVAGLVSILPEKKTSDEQDPSDRMDLLPSWNSLMVRGLLAQFPGITETALRMTGAVFALYPKGKKRPYHCVVVPAYGPYLCNAEPVGYIVMQSSGKMLPTRNGDQKRISICKTGLVGKRGLTMIADKRAKLIIKVEGFSDLGTMQSKVCENENYKELIAVITNACGSRETTLPQEVAGIFSTIPTIIIHDADDPGQDGAALWVEEVGKCTEVANPQLPYPIEPKHGKDVRNWFTDLGNEGRTIDDFLGLVRDQYPGFLDAFDEVASGVSKKEATSASPESGNGVHRDNGSHSGNGAIPQNRLAKDEAAGDAGKNHAGLPDKSGVANPAIPAITQYQIILKRLGMIVLGMPEGTNNVAGFCERTGRTFILERISSLKVTDLVLHLGPEIVAEIQTGDEKDPNKIAMSAIQLAIAAEGSKTRLTGRGYLGVGIWEIGGRLIVVNAGEATIINGDITRTKIPTHDGRIFDFGESQKWFDHDWFVSEFERNSDREYSKSVLNDAIEIFGRWDNWAHSRNPELVASLVCCSWIQTVWEYRPQACVIGATNSGKSSLFSVLKGMFCNSRMTVGGADPTAAGLRQELRNTAKIIFADEFEHHSRRRECLDMFRASSSGETIIRGTAGQKGLSFTLRHLPWHGAITSNNQSAADRNRYLILELNPVEKGRGSTLQVPDSVACEELGLKLMVVGVKYWQRAKQIASAIKKTAFGEIDRRVVSSFSVPCSMISAVLDLNESEAVELTRDILKERNFEEQSESDEQSLLREIYESPVQLEGGKKSTMSMLIKGTHGNSHGAPDAMIRCGVRKISKNGVEYLFFCESSICANLFTDQSKKSMGVSQILARIAGAVRDKQRMGAHNSRGVSIPLSTVNLLLGIREGEEDQSFDEIGVGDRAEITGLEF